MRPRRPGRRSAPPVPDPMAVDHWTRTLLLAERAMAGGSGRRWNYTWCTLHAAGVARSLGIDRISVVELGCAGGNGLVALEHAAEAAETELGVGVDVHGFDNAVGLPAPEDHRDAPYLMQPGEYPMDVAALRARLRRTELHLGLVAQTVEELRSTAAAPIGFVSFDLDFYSSTRDALTLFAGDDPTTMLPRVLCYFDDVVGYPWGDSNGPRPAVREFNDANEGRRLVDVLYGMRHLVPVHQRDARWVECLFLAHVLDHPRYAEDEHTRISARLDLH